MGPVLDPHLCCFLMILGGRFGLPNPWKGAQEAKKVRIARAPGPYGGPRGVQSSPGRVRRLQKPPKINFYLAPKASKNQLLPEISE